jgi:hypothetical protein
MPRRSGAASLTWMVVLSLDRGKQVQVGHDATDIAHLGADGQRLQEVLPRIATATEPQAAAKRDELEQLRTPMSTSKGFIQQTIDEMNGLIDNAALDTRVAWVRDIMDRVTVEAARSMPWPSGARHPTTVLTRSDSVSSWLRRTGAGRVLNRLGTTTHEIALPHPGRSREWLTVALLECSRCHQVVEGRSPTQRLCPSCRRQMKAARSYEAMRHARGRR